MKPLRWIVLGCVCVLSLPMVTPGKGSDSIEALVQRVDAQYAHLKDFQADFVQETRIQGFDTPLRSSGRVYLKKPGRLRWDYMEPSVEHMYVDRDRLALYVPAHNQVLKGSLTMMVATKAPLQLLQGIGKLAEHFFVHPTGNGAVGEGGLPLLTLIPKPFPDSVPSSIVKIVSEIQPDTYFIRSLSLHEGNGNVSTFRFSNFKANRGLDETVFILNLPEGVVIVEDVLPKS